jgi:hypothetical protein
MKKVDEPAGAGGHIYSRGSPNDLTRKEQGRMRGTMSCYLRLCCPSSGPTVSSQAILRVLPDDFSKSGPVLDHLRSMEFLLFRLVIVQLTCQIFFNVRVSVPSSRIDKTKKT